MIGVYGVYSSRFLIRGLRDDFEAVLDSQWDSVESYRCLDTLFTDIYIYILNRPACTHSILISG